MDGWSGQGEVTQGAPPPADVSGETAFTSLEAASGAYSLLGGFEEHVRVYFLVQIHSQGLILFPPAKGISVQYLLLWQSFFQAMHFLRSETGKLYGL